MVVMARREVMATMVTAVMAEAVMRTAVATVMAIAVMMAAILHLGDIGADIALHGGSNARAVQRHRRRAFGGSSYEQQSCDRCQTKDLLEVHFRFLVPHRDDAARQDVAALERTLGRRA